jgi:hypothetical protein
MLYNTPHVRLPSAAGLAHHQGGGRGSGTSMIDSLSSTPATPHILNSARVSYGASPIG